MSAASEPFPAFPEDLARAIARIWWLPLVLGIASITVGIFVLVWPGVTLVVLAALFGVWLVVTGAVRIVSVFTARWESTAMRVLMGVLGVAMVAIGLYALFNLVESIALLAVFIGVTWLVDGVAELIPAFTGGRDQPGRGWRIFSAIVSVIGGIVVLLWPGLSLLTLVIVSGVLLIVFGVIRIVLALRLRRLGSEAAAPA